MLFETVNSCSGVHSHHPKEFGGESIIVVPGKKVYTTTVAPVLSRSVAHCNGTSKEVAAVLPEGVQD